MNSILIKRLTTTLFALGVSATAVPASAITNITSCSQITQSGSYRVTQNLSLKSSTQCLLINASHVTIDLQGHTITGVFGATGIAVSLNSSLSNIEVRNGTITSFSRGISLIKVQNARVEGMRVFDSEDTGILIDEGSGAVISANIAARNGEFGILVGNRNGSGGTALVTDNIVSGHHDGIVVLGVGNTVRNNVANNNARSGISVDCPSLLSENTAVGNGRVNIDVRGTGCRASINLAPGTVR